jgi:hypothetical protein
VGHVVEEQVVGPVIEMDQGTASGEEPGQNAFQALVDALAEGSTACWQRIANILEEPGPRQPLSLQTVGDIKPVIIDGAQRLPRLEDKLKRWKAARD